MPSDTGRSALDVHSTLFEAKAALDGLRALCVPQSNEHLSALTGFQLDMLLRPISQALEDCLCATESLQQSRSSRAGVQ